MNKTEEKIKGRLKPTKATNHHHHQQHRTKKKERRQLKDATSPAWENSFQKNGQSSSDRHFC